MGKAYFLFAVHNHQPVGNFERVFSKAWKTCYAPFLELLEAHPAVKCTLHYSGPLLEWMESHQRGAFSELKGLVGKGQVELLGGAFYEAILPAISREDALGQLELMNCFLKDAFGRAPKGLWLAERVWEPQLASLIAASGLRYTLLDDSHFTSAGMERDDLAGYYVTEDDGATLAIFPIDKRMRYIVPFGEPDAALDYLRQSFRRSPGCAITLGDDGEKFGLWPGTYKWVYEEKYLERLFTLIEDSGDWLTTLTLGDYLDKSPPRGRVYLPAASYEEMMEWALPAEMQVRYRREVDRLKGEGRLEPLAPFIRGAPWRSFFVKYPESNLQRCKALHVSRMLQANIPGDMEARKSLWRSQCNCAYWHGLFGGLYLNYLRRANYGNMLRAEIAADRAVRREGEWTAAERIDFDQDGEEEVLLRSATLNAFIAPVYGGAIFELDFKPRCINLCDTLARRQEAYHAAMMQAGDRKSTGGKAPPPLPDVAKHASRRLLKALHYDWYLRRSFLDHLLGPSTTPENFEQCRYPEQGGFVNQPYEIVSVAAADQRAYVSLRRRGIYHAPEGRSPLDIEKSFTLHGDGRLSVEYRIINPSSRMELPIWLGIELSLTLLAGQSRDRYIALPLARLSRRMAGSRGTADGIDSLDLVSKPDGFAVRLAWSEKAGLWHFPLETVSQSEKGFDLSYQGTVVMPHFRFILRPRGEKRLNFSLVAKVLP